MSTSTRPPHLGVTESLPRMVRRLGLRPPLLPPALARQLPAIIEPLTSLPPVRRLASKMLINYYSYATSLRPRALSMASDYTTWSSLTDHKFTGRHLPPGRPGVHRGAALRERRERAAIAGSEEIKSADTSVWFMFFAQWFVDSFLRTSREDFRQNTSTQEIDLCQIYGLGPAQTRDAALVERRPAEEPADRRRGVPGVPLPGAQARWAAGVQARVRRAVRRALRDRHDPR